MSYKIINNKIYINRGETATYDVLVQNADGSPTRLPSGDDTLGIEFVVSNSRYRRSEILFRKLLLPTEIGGDEDPDITDLKTFTNLDLLERTGNIDFTTPPTLDEYLADSLYVYTGGSEPEYKYASEIDYLVFEWLPYELKLTFPIQNEDTASAEPKTYWYEVYAIRGVLTGKEFTSINYKLPLQESKEFIIGGSTSGK